MGKHLWVEEDEFALALSEIFGDILDASEEALFACVHDAVEMGRDEWRNNAASHSAKYHKGNWEYGQHVTFRTLRKKSGIEGHIYSKKPGLPHLLEKGHAKIGGGSTAAYPSAFFCGQQAAAFSPVSCQRPSAGTGRNFRPVAASGGHCRAPGV